MWYRLLPAICYLSGLLAARIPAYDYFDDNFYYELRNLLEMPSALSGGGGPREVRGWGPGKELGQVSGVSVDPEGRPVIFHRGTRVWDYKSFNSTHHYQGKNGTIAEDPILVLNPETGTVLSSWGHGHFILPHGITVDAHGNTWVTDVALHQVFKFAPNSNAPEITVGEAGVPGSDEAHLCKPTSVAVATQGDFFVADGYCNARILHFGPDGKLKGKFGHRVTDGSNSGFFIPHGLALDEGRDTLCVADRENHRVLCIRTGLSKHPLGTHVVTLHNQARSRVYDVATLNGVLLGVGGSVAEGDAGGFTADLSSGKVVGPWGPVQGFRNPHALAINKDGSSLYVAEIGPNKIWKFALGTAEA